MKAKIINTGYALILISLGYFATDIYLPSFPAISEHFQTSELSTQMTFTSYLLSFSMTPLIFGPISDHIGRKKVITFGLIFSLLATIACYIPVSITWLIVMRFFQGIGAGGVLIAARAMIPDLYKGQELAKQTSYVTMSMPLILAFGPTLGGLLQESFGWQSVFLFLIFYILVILCATYFMGESLEAPSKKSASQVFHSYIELFSHRAFLLFGLGMVIPSIGLFAYLTASPFIFQEIIGLSPFQYGFLAIYVGISIMLMSSLNATLLHYCSINSLIWVGSGLTALAGLLMLAFHGMGWLNTWTILFPTLIYFGCLPFSMSNSAAKAMTLIQENFGAATAMLATLQFLAGMMGSLVFSVIDDVDGLPLGICYLLVGLFSAILLRAACAYEKEKTTNSTR